MPHPFHVESDQVIQGFLGQYGKLLKETIPPETGYVLLIGPLKGGGQRYISNLRREDSVRWLMLAGVAAGGGKKL